MYVHTGLHKTTQPSAWCGFASAGDLTAKLLWGGLLLGLAVTGLTGMYALQMIPWVADQFDKIEALGFSDLIQKYIMATCWVALWAFLFTSMALYSASIPDTLGWGTVELEASFGLLQLSFVLVSANCALAINSIWELWSPRALAAVWDDFRAARPLSARKALYVGLTTQLVLYVIMVVHEVDWALLLLVLSYFYLLSHNPTFLVLYLVLSTISILFDAIRAAELPAFASMTAGEAFGNSLWIAVFALKPVLFLLLILHHKLEANAIDDANRKWARLDDERAA